MKGIWCVIPALMLIVSCASNPSTRSAQKGEPPQAGQQNGMMPPSGGADGASGPISMGPGGPPPSMSGKNGMAPPNMSKEPPSRSVDTSWIKTKYLDVVYATKSSSEKLDLYLPNEGSGPFPLIIEFHSGAFMTGSKSEDIGPMLEGLKRGYAVASVGYRLSGEAIFPAAINDAKAAVKYLRANAQLYHLNPDKFAAWGSSAGGNIAAMLATSADTPSLVDTSLGYADVSDAVQAAVDWFGPLYFGTMDAQFKALGIHGLETTSDFLSTESKYLGKTVGAPEAQSLVDQASPYTYISSKTAPLYIQHGISDHAVPITQSKIFAEKLRAAIGVDKVIFDSIEGADHEGAQFKDPKNIAKILDFLDKYLK